MRLILILALVVIGLSRQLTNEQAEYKSPLCDFCLGAVSLLRSSQKLVPKTLFKNLLRALCIRKSKNSKNSAKNKNLCDHVSQQLTPIILQSLWRRYFNPRLICGKMNLCKKYYKKLHLDEEILRIIKSDVVVKEKVKRQRKFYKILQISDVHLDLQYKPGTMNTCDDILCCHSENGQGTTKNDTAGYFGDYKCDVPINFLDQTVKSIKNNHPDIDLILVSGDMSAHNEWSKSIQSNNFITKFVINRLSSVSSEIVFALGNNECFPDHQFDVRHEESLKEGIAIALEDYLTEKQAKTLKKNGYYSRWLPNMNLKVISLNSQVCDNTNFYLIGNITDPSGQLQWLENQLKNSEKLNQNVYIMGHIPPSLLECSTTWSEIYRALIGRFNKTIKGQFFGHTHNDQFVVYTNSLTKEPSGILWSVPSMTPIMGHQPAYRVYLVDQDMKVLDYWQYAADLVKSNQKALYEKNPDVIWVNTYNFVSEYQIKDASTKEIAYLRDLMKVDQQLLRRYHSHITGGTHSSFDKNALLCQTHDSHEDTYDCLKKSPKSDTMTYLTQMLQGPWYKYIRQ